MDLAISLLILVALTLIFDFLKLPLILAYLISGLVSSYFMELDKDILEIVNESAIAFLLFFIGFEFSFNKIRKFINKKLINFLMTFIIFTLVGFLLGFVISKSFKDAFLLGIVLYAASSLIVIKILQNTGRLANPETPYIMIALIIEDIIVPISFGFLLGSFTLISILNVLLITLAVWLNYKFRNVIKEITGYLVSLKKEVFLIFIVSLIIVSILILSSPVGAFVIGILISDTYEKFFEKELSSIREVIFISFFFAFGYTLRTILLTFSPMHLLIAFILFIITPLLQYFYFYNVLGPREIIRAILSKLPRGEFSIYATHLMANEELKTIAFLYIIISVMIGSLVSHYSRKI